MGVWPSFPSLCRRKRVPNVAYGYGTHVCIGEYLSLVELECAFKGLFTRLPNLRVSHAQATCSGIGWSQPERALQFWTLLVSQLRAHACSILQPVGGNGCSPRLGAGAERTVSWAWEKTVCCRVGHSSGPS